MSDGARIGIELGARTVRVVRVPNRWDHWRRRRIPVAVELAWDPDQPGDTGSRLRDQLGARDRVAVSIDVPLLFVKHVTLPPVPAAEKARIVALEPERFFAARGEEMLVAAASDSDLVFAARGDAVATWVRALEDVGPVVSVEPAPVALTRALVKAGVTDAAVLRDAGGDGVELTVVRARRLSLVRRIFGDVAEAARALRGVEDPPARVFLSPWSEDGARCVASELGGPLPEPLPAVDDVSAPFLPAFGAALTAESGAERSLAPGELTARMRTRRRRERVMALVACVAALVFAVTSLDAWRERALTSLQTALASLRDRAAPALALQHEILAAQHEAQALHAITRERPEPLRVLAALSRQLPPGAYVRSLRFSATAWQIEGYAPNAAAVLAQLSQSPALSNLRFLSGTTRVTIGPRTYETFALAFQFAAAP